MKNRIIQQTCVSLGLGLLLCLPSFSYAGGDQPQATKGEVIAKFKPVKSDKDLNDLEPGDVIVKVCRDCGDVTMVRVEKAGKGVYDYLAKKCEGCGSENTYMATTKQFIPFKESEKQ